MRSILPLLVGATLVASPLFAQGTQYRIRLNEPWSLRLGPQVRTTLDQRRPDSLPLPTRQGTTQMVPRRAVMRIDSLIGILPRGARMRHSMLSGVIVGTLAGAGLGYLGYQKSKHGSFDSRGANVLGGALIVGGFGTLVGAALGAARSGEQWQQVWP